MNGLFRYDSPAGALAMSISDSRITSVGFDGGERLPLLPEGAARRAFDDYFKRGVAFDPDRYRLDARGFTRAVLEAAIAIPCGQVRTYAQIAADAGSPGAHRAAGNALGSNPIPVVVPCHRVVGTGGLGGYRGGLAFKQFLLALEGAVLPGSTRRATSEAAGFAPR
ncbi:MAG: methylated-DNA--[protein]-cysteine S-methyltransferase [Actinomycetota bacterium]